MMEEILQRASIVIGLLVVFFANLQKSAANERPAESWIHWCAGF